MDLWIRTQDKRQLLKVNDGLFIANGFTDTDDTFIGIKNVGHIGRYTEEKRALEILDEIQEILRPTLIFNKCKVDAETLKEIELPENAILLQSSNNAEITYNGDYVYEMPEE